MSRSNGTAERFDLATAMTRIEDRFGAGAVAEIGSGATVAVDAIPTGALSLDLALGVGGLPRGRIVEVYGPESSGKTTLAYHAIAEAQRLGGRCAFIDAEHAMDPHYASAIGVDVEGLLLCQPDHGEQALEVADLLVQSGEVALVVIDSVAALVPRAELEATMDEQQVGLQARMMSKGLRRLAGHLREAGAPPCCSPINSEKRSASSTGRASFSPVGGRSSSTRASASTCAASRP